MEGDVHRDGRKVLLERKNSTERMGAARGGARTDGPDGTAKGGRLETLHVRGLHCQTARRKTMSAPHTHTHTHAHADTCMGRRAALTLDCGDSLPLRVSLCSLHDSRGQIDCTLGHCSARSIDRGQDG